MYTPTHSFGSLKKPAIHPPPHPALTRPKCHSHPKHWTALPHLGHLAVLPEPSRQGILPPGDAKLQTQHLISRVSLPSQSVKKRKRVACQAEGEPQTVRFSKNVNYQQQGGPCNRTCHTPRRAVVRACPSHQPLRIEHIQARQNQCLVLSLSPTTHFHEPLESESAGNRWQYL